MWAVQASAGFMDDSHSVLPVQDPLGLFAAWFDEAGASEPNDANAMALATATAEGAPSVRMVLVRGIDESGLRFYTNYKSRKAAELGLNPHAALAFSHSARADTKRYNHNHHNDSLELTPRHYMYTPD